MERLNLGIDDDIASRNEENIEMLKRRKNYQFLKTIVNDNVDK
jgi:hypothetical protein